MKILTSSQIREADQFTIENEPISPEDLMERAATRLFDYLQPLIDPKKTIAVVCGTGNNGGDGLVLARLLKGHQYTVDVFVVPLGDASAEFRLNEARLPMEAEPALDADFSEYDVIIDGIFGSGLNRPVFGEPGEVIRRMNEAQGWKISIDLPSGLFSDGVSPGENIFSADITLTFQQPKLALLMPQNGQYTGHWEVLDIGLHPEFLERVQSSNILITEDLVLGFIRTRNKFSHKGDFGKALLMAGSKGKMGAAVLASRTALRAGLGLLTAFIPRSGNTVMQTAVPEAMVILDEGDDHLTGIPEKSDFDVIGVGPGIGTDSQTEFALEEVLRITSRPMVIDADALNILAAKPGFMKLVPEYSILTPHPGEFRRLAGPWENDFQRLTLQKDLARETRTIVVLKGANSSIAMPDGRVFFNSTGNPGMATAGSGDVLTGIITGLLAQGYLPEAAAISGTYLHGLAGDIAAAELSEQGLVSGDIVDYLPAAWNLLK